MPNKSFSYYIKTFCVFLFSINTLYGQSGLSPDKFLGYTIGQQYTPHYKIVSYIKALFQAHTDIMRVEKYGETFEGRDLMLVYLSSPENMAKLDDIRKNNLRLAGILKDKPADIRSPAIVWLSYNVHGNEPSSSEAALLTLYALTENVNESTNNLLKNTVVIIDPCLNPDGRERYVQWFNQVKGKKADADPQSREHNEPWPGGRSNHYNFDLNRDWAWQTQIETQQRMVKYNQWLPQVHVDFHEQYYNNPYYFAPAAEPFHEAITPWQREFQNIIGKKNAKYFDEKGWLYFTKESFDLFYPSYGDTYPIYNGSIGMTYEQGGHSRGGLSVVTNTGDTLTLAERALHHYTTGLSTIETSSENAVQLVTEFKKYFDNSRAGVGSEYKTYILTSNNKMQLNNITQFLEKNGIEYGMVDNIQNIRGIEYSTGKESVIKLKNFHIAISSNQPKSILAKVLLEPKSNLADSVTYDITAWSLPFVYGIEAFASKTLMTIKKYQPTVNGTNQLSSNYGYLIPYNSINSVKALTQLLQQNIRVRYAEKPFIYNKKSFERGTLIILQKGNTDQLAKVVKEIASINDIEIEPVATGYMEKGPDFGSADIKLIKAPRVALLTGEQVSSLGAGEVWHLFDQQINYPVTLLQVADLPRLSLNKYNVIIMPEGYYSTLENKITADKLKEFVQNGGNLIAMGGAAQELSKNTDWGFKIKENKEEKKDSVDYGLIKRYENRERDNVINNIPGAIYKLQLDNSHPLAFGYTNYYYTLKQDPAVYEYLKDGWNVGVLKRDNYVTGFAGSKVKEAIKDGVIFGHMPIGSGNFIFLADNPIFRQFWEGGKLLFCNAVFLFNN